LSAENIRLSYIDAYSGVCSLKLIGQIGPTSLSLVAINHDVSNYSAGVIDSRHVPKCTKEVLVFYKTAPSQPVIHFIINPSLACMEELSREVALLATFNYASQFYSKYASIAYPKDRMNISDRLTQLVKCWHKMKRGEILKSIGELELPLVSDKIAYERGGALQNS